MESFHKLHAKDHQNMAGSTYGFRLAPIEEDVALPSPFFYCHSQMTTKRFLVGYGLRTFVTYFIKMKLFIIGLFHLLLF